MDHGCKSAPKIGLTERLFESFLFAVVCGIWAVVLPGIYLVRYLGGKCAFCSHPAHASDARCAFSSGSCSCQRRLPALRATLPFVGAAGILWAMFWLIPHVVTRP